MFAIISKPAPDFLFDATDKFKDFYRICLSKDLNHRKFASELRTHSFLQTEVRKLLK
jgi:hypothetical protein